MDHPLVIFLDDLQWADLASLDLMKVLFSDSHPYLLFIAAYRDNEVSPRHPMMLTVAEIQGLGNQIVEIRLENLKVF